MPRGRPRKLSIEQVQQAAVDRRTGMSWRLLGQKYGCAVNTIKTALSDYSDEFKAIPPIQRTTLESQLAAAHTKIDRLERALKKRFNLHV